MSQLSNCPNCGAAIAESESKCSYCGTAIPQDKIRETKVTVTRNTYTTTESYDGPTQSQSDTSEQWNRNGIGCLIFIIGLTIWYFIAKWLQS